MCHLPFFKKKTQDMWFTVNILDLQYKNIAFNFKIRQFF